MKVTLKTELKPQWNIHNNLTPNTIYTVIEICSGYYRLIDDTGDPVLFDMRAFDIVDNSIPSDWVYQVWTYDEGEIFHDPDCEDIVYQKFTEFYSLIPRCFSEPNNFFERYHDDDPECMRIFKEYIKNME